jgi:hypothetical protein
MAKQKGDCKARAQEIANLEEITWHTFMLFLYLSIHAAFNTAAVSTSRGAAHYLCVDVPPFTG